MYLSRNIILTLLLLLINFTACAQEQSGTAAANFVALSDIHFDPFYTCKKDIIACPIIKQLVKTEPKYWAQVLAHYDGGAVSAYHNDTNYPLLKSTLAAASQMSKPKQPKFILILGDFLAHNYKINYQLYTGDLSQSGYETFVKKTMQFLTLQIQNAFPNASIYPVVGNNDSYGDDYEVVPSGRFFTDTATTWSSLLQGDPGTYAQTFPLAGYYALSPVNAPQLRLIVLNTVLFAKKGDAATQKAALQELNWLQEQLEAASKQQQKVWLVAHIPVGINVYTTLKSVNKQIDPFWLDSYTHIFQNILTQYSPIITAIMTSHIHMDGFQIISAPKPIPNSVVSAVSPMFGNNPSFKIYTYSLENLELQDFATYYLNERARNDWQKEYQFSSFYLPNCKRCDLLKRMQSIKKTGLAANAYQIFYTISTHSQPISQNKWLPYYWCAINNITVNDYQKCITKN
jgi:hypothetical protein